MAENDRILVDLSDNTEEEFEKEFNGVKYNFKAYRNAQNDRIYMSIFDENMVPIITGEKLMYGMEIFGTISEPRLPAFYVIPYDESDQVHEVTGATFQSPVFIFLPQDDDEDADGSETDFNDDLDDDEESIESADQTISDDDAINLYGTDQIVGGED